MSYVTAQEAAAILGVSRATLYAYVSRRGIRSIPIEGSRQRLYWESDVREVRRPRGRPPRGDVAEQVESSLSLIDAQHLYYRGEKAVALAEFASLEDVAELLWIAPPGTVTPCPAVKLPPLARSVMARLGDRSGIERAVAAMPLIEAETPRAYDLTAHGMAASGAEALRMLAAILLKRDGLGRGPVHIILARSLGLDAAWEDIVRRLLVLSADHGLEAGTVAVRAMAALGISPYRSIAGGLLLMGGRQSAMSKSEHIRHFLDEIETLDPKTVVVQRLREDGRVPGFGSPLYPDGDPRARALWGVLAPQRDSDPQIRSLGTAIEYVRNELGSEPNFALLVHAVNKRIMSNRRDTLFVLGRSVGWIGHAIERYCAGEQDRLPALYTGPLPEGR